MWAHIKLSFPTLLTWTRQRLLVPHREMFGNNSATCWQRRTVSWIEKRCKLTCTCSTNEASPNCNISLTNMTTETGMHVIPGVSINQTAECHLFLDLPKTVNLPLSTCFLLYNTWCGSRHVEKDAVRDDGLGSSAQTRAPTKKKLIIIIVIIIINNNISRNAAEKCIRE